MCVLVKIVQSATICVFAASNWLCLEWLGYCMHRVHRRRFVCVFGRSVCVCPRSLCYSSSSCITLDHLRNLICLGFPRLLLYFLTPPNRFSLAATRQGDSGTGYTKSRPFARVRSRAIRCSRARSTRTTTKGARHRCPLPAARCLYMYMPLSHHVLTASS